MVKNNKKQTNSHTATQENFLPNVNFEKKFAKLLDQCVKSIASYSDYTQVTGVLFQSPNNLVVTSSKVSNQTRLLLKSFQLPLTKFKKICQQSTPLKIAHFGTTYYFSTQEGLAKEFDDIFYTLSATTNPITKYDYIINPLLGNNNTLLGLIIVPYPTPGLIPKVNSILPIITFANEFVSAYQKILLSNETLLLKPIPTQDLLQVDEYLETLEKTRQEFVAMLVHDIRSPLTVVLGTLDLLLIQSRKRTDIKITPNLSSLITIAHETCKQIIHMVTELLDLSRMEHAPLQLNKTFIIPQEMITSVVEDCYNSALEKQIRLNFGCSPDLKPILADIEYLQRALVNLLSNAIKYTPENGEIWFEARAITDNNHKPFLSFTVIDSGLGISEEEQPYIFDPYFQASNRKGKLGIGLGLAIVKKIALAHNGNVSVKSQLGIGSAFSLAIPIENNNS